MTDISDYTSVFRTQKATAPGEPIRAKIKRNRIPVSCSACRVRKLKCDRQHPCGACDKRGDAASCHFVANPASADLGDGSSGSSSSSKLSGAAGLRNGKSSRSQAQASLQRLEEVVNDLLQHRSDSSSTTDDGSSIGRFSSDRDTSRSSSTSARSPPDLGDDVAKLSIVNSNTVKSSGCARGVILRGADEARNGDYVGATNWAAVLDRIRDVQGYLESDDPFDADGPELLQETEHHAPQADMVLGSVPPLNITEALTALPPKAEAAKLMSIFFRARFTAAPFIHMHKFQRDFDQFYRDPSSTSWMWISLLFSALAIASKIVMSSDGNSVGIPIDDSTAAALAYKACQCLVVGNYSKSQPQVIEALLLFAYAKYWLNFDPGSDVWNLFGLATRLAQKMGYHRDPTSFRGNKMSPFESEMRRRVWFFVEVFDLNFSFQLGIPAIIHEDECDMLPPSNILDDDFDESSLTLPPSRPYTEYSPTLCHHFKSRLLRTFRKVLRSALTVNIPHFDQVCRLDDEMTSIFNEMPECLRVRPMDQYSFGEENYAIVSRLMVEMLYLRAKCVLHRSYLSYDKLNPTYERSRVACRTAALRILELVAQTHQESKPGGRLYVDRWLLGGIRQHDFILAAMLVCLDLEESPDAGDEESARARKVKIDALKQSYQMCEDRKHQSRDSSHAAKVIRAILTKVLRRTAAPDATANVQSQNAVQQQPPPPPPQANPSANLASWQMPEVVGNSPRPQADNSVSLNGIDADPTMAEAPQNGLLAVSPDFDFMDTGRLDDVLGNVDNIDWSLVDQYMFDRLPETEDPSMDPAAI